MSRKSKSPSNSQPKQAAEQGRYWTAQDAPWGGFVNLKTSIEQRSQYEEWLAPNPTAFWLDIEDLLTQGMKIAFSYDRENDCAICTLTGALVSGSTERYCLVSRAATWDESASLSVFKFRVLMNGSADEYRPRTGKMDNWG